MGVEATTFDVAFLTDPVGPKALPLLTAVVFFAAGVSLAARPGAPVAWPPHAVVRRMVAATAILLLWAVALAPLGFVVATTVAVGALSLTFGAPPLRAFAAALALSAVMWYGFVWALSLPLPPGSLWTP